jgi:hypothetical protein
MELRPPTGVRLLPLIHSLSDIPPLTATLGMLLAGRPLLMNLAKPESWHMQISGPPGCGKSELLRSAVLSLALTNRRSQLALIGIDLSGRELMVMESLPHTMTDVATEPRYAGELVNWLAEELVRRIAQGVSSPHIVLASDGLSWLQVSGDAGTQAAFGAILRNGGKAGVHVLAADEFLEPRSRWRSSSVWAEPIIDAQGRIFTGQFEFRTGRRSLQADGAWMSVSDLDTATRLIAAGWRATAFLPVNGRTREHQP